MFLRHASDPDRRVVGGVAGHRQNASGLDIDDYGRARVTGIALPLRSLHRPHELVFHDGLQTGVQTRDQVLPRLGIELFEGAGHPTSGVHRERGDAGLSPHFLVVVRLQARATDDVGTSQPVGCGCRPLLLELFLGQRTEVTQQVSGVDVEGGGVFANRIESRIDTPIHLPLFHDGERRLRINVLGDRHRLVRGAVPAHRRRLRVLGPARLQAVGDFLRGEVQDPSQSLDHGIAAIGLAAELDLVHRDHQRRAIRHQGSTDLVEDKTTNRGFDDFANGVVHGGDLVFLPRHDLEVEQPPDQGENEGKHEGPKHEQPYIGPLTHGHLLSARPLVYRSPPGVCTP